MGNRLLCARLLLIRAVDHFPSLLNLLLEAADGELVLLTELERRLHLGGVGNNLRVELPALLDKPPLIVCKTAVVSQL